MLTVDATVLLLTMSIVTTLIIVSQCLNGRPDKTSGDKTSRDITSRVSSSGGSKHLAVKNIRTDKTSGRQNVCWDKTSVDISFMGKTSVDITFMGQNIHRHNIHGKNIRVDITSVGIKRPET
jgi:hypothetical protein